MPRWLIPAGVLLLGSFFVVGQLVLWTWDSFWDYEIVMTKPWLPWSRLAFTAIMSLLIFVIDIFGLKLIGRLRDD